MSALTDQAAGPRMAILTVDDDPAVSRAVARDLRRRYGERHRVVRAESSSAALVPGHRPGHRGIVVDGQQHGFAWLRGACGEA